MGGSGLKIVLIHFDRLGKVPVQFPALAVVATKQPNGSESQMTRVLEILHNLRNLSLVFP